jgi:hypothetical protein
VGAVYELPKNVRRVGDVDCVHRMSADVRIPSGDGGWEASYMRLALGLWYLLLVCDVRQGFWRGWWVDKPRGASPRRDYVVKRMVLVQIEYNLVLTLSWCRDISKKGHQKY